MYTLRQNYKKFYNQLDKGTHDIHVNLQDVSYLDSTGLGLFVGTLKSLNEHGKSLYVLGVSERIERLFEITVLKNSCMSTRERR